MCGRFTLSLSREVVEGMFHIVPPPDTEPRYNIAPTQDVLIVCADDASSAAKQNRKGVLVRWGFVPHYANDPGEVGAKMINARSESVFENRAYRTAAAKYRCLIPADGFYEWKKLGKRKQPYHFRKKDGTLFAMAGIRSRWTNADGDVIESCAILTTEANELVGQLHHRMPVILASESDCAEWLDGSKTDRDALAHLLQPSPEDLLVAVPVSMLVNNVRIDDSACIDEAELLEDPAQKQMGFGFED